MSQDDSGQAVGPVVSQDDSGQAVGPVVSQDDSGQAVGPVVSQDDSGQAAGRQGRFPAPVVVEPTGAATGWRVVARTIPAAPAIMGILNVTPDSFSDGGQWAGDAVARGLELVAQGADIVDIGGESTRPGAQRITVGEELDRVIPVVTALSRAGVLVSVDTMRASVAREAVGAGARIINDVSGGLADPTMASVASEIGAVYVAMHWRGHSDRMADHAHYANVVTEVVAELTVRVDELTASGIQREALVLDPGLGFSKAGDDNWRLLAGLSQLTELGLPILVGASRKRFLGELLGIAAPRERDAATTAVSMISATVGAWAVRVHDVSATWDTFQVMQTYQAYIDSTVA